MLSRIIKNTWDCIRYPFLYQRNRFSGLHYTNWELSEWIHRKESRSSLFVILDLTEDEVSGPQEWITSQGDVLSIEIDYRTNEVLIVKSGFWVIERVLKRIKVPGKILGAVWGEKEGNISVQVIRKPDNPCFIGKRVIYDPFGWGVAKIIDWFYRWPLQIIHCLSEGTELDSLDTGWRKAFGEDLCKDLRRAIIKDCGLRGLFRFRVIQIKEKWGYLHFYYNGGGEETQKVISKYEDLSEKICISCGKPATWRTTGWICPYCDDCIGPNDPYGGAERIEKEEGT